MRHSFPLLPLIFQHVCELRTGRAFDVMVGEVLEVPVVDLFVAGFARKSVSTESTQRGRRSQCIADATGQTGETFQGVLGYTRRFKPKLVICENVAGLLKRTCGCDAQIHLARKCFEQLGYAFAYVQVDARTFSSLSDARASGCGLVGRT